MSKRQPGERAGLTSEVILETGLELINSGGFDALTMRSLAHRLAVAPNAIYSYFSDKSALIDALLDHILGLIDMPVASRASPTKRLTTLLEQTYEVLLRYPNLTSLFMKRQGASGVNAERLGELMDADLRRLDLTPAEVSEARNTLIVHVIGWASFAVASIDATGRIDERHSHKLFRQSLGWLLIGLTQGK